MDTVRPMGQFHFDPHTYAQTMREEVPAYGSLQEAIAVASRLGSPVRRALELGVGTGVTGARVLVEHADAELVGIDHGPAMLAVAREALPAADLRESALEDPLPEGPFDLVFSALAVHHLDGPGKAELFGRVAATLAPGGRFVLGDLIVPEDQADVVTPIDGEIDTPSSIGEQMAWLEEAGLSAYMVWRDRDLAVLVGERPA